MPNKTLLRLKLTGSRTLVKRTTWQRDCFRKIDLSLDLTEYELSCRKKGKKSQQVFNVKC